jgi:hypothetical protein
MLSEEKIMTEANLFFFAVVFIGWSLEFIYFNLIYYYINIFTG